MAKEQRPVGLDLFCGAGGMSLGFEQAGFDVCAAVDVDPIHVETYANNFPSCRALCADLSRLSGRELRERTGLGQRPIDVLFGGPPCEGFSFIGKRRRDDPRNLLILDFARLVRELCPSYFVVENVQGLLAGEAVAVLQSFVRRVKRAGYMVVSPIRTLDASDFGVPERRRRVFIIGYKGGLQEPKYPESPFADDGNGRSRRPTVWDAIGDLPNIDDLEELLAGDEYHGPLGVPSRYAEVLRGWWRDPVDQSRPRSGNGNGLTGCLRTAHGPESVRRFGATEPGTHEPISRFYRLDRGGLAPALRAGSDRFHGSFSAPRPIHPLHPRCITVREAARLHSFPDWFQFHPTKWHGFRQVGNSVPPFLARAVAGSMMHTLQCGY